MDFGWETDLMIYRIKKQKKKKRGVDYNAEIPFEKKPAPGIYMYKAGLAKKWEILYFPGQWEILVYPGKYWEINYNYIPVFHIISFNQIC